MSVNPIDLSAYGIDVADVVHNATPARLYEFAIVDHHAVIAASGALATRSGDKTGRSPKDKRIVDAPASSNDIWWGDINIRMTERSFLINRQRAIDYLNTRPRIFVFDGYAGWDPDYQIKVRVIAESAYHALFMHNMLNTPRSVQQCSSSPINCRCGSVESVVFPVPDKPKNSDTSPSAEALALQCMLSTFCFGIK